MNHVPENLLSAFVEGELDDAMAVHIAEHIDACAVCLARTAALEPLSAAFAAYADPTPPVGLAAAALAAAARPTPQPAVARAAVDVHVPRRSPWREIAAGTVLMSAAALLAAWVDPNARAIATEPVAVLAGAVRLLTPLDSLADAARAALGTSWHGLLLASGMAAWGLVATWRLATAPVGDPTAHGSLLGGSP